MHCIVQEQLTSAYTRTCAFMHPCMHVLYVINNIVFIDQEVLYLKLDCNQIFKFYFVSYTETCAMHYVSKSKFTTLTVYYNPAWHKSNIKYIICLHSWFIKLLWLSVFKAMTVSWKDLIKQGGTERQPRRQYSCSQKNEPYWFCFCLQLDCIVGVLYMQCGSLLLNTQPLQDIS